MDRKQFFFQMDVKDVTPTDKNTLIIEGFASTPDIDRYRDIVEPTAFKNAVEMYMKNPVILYQHDPNRPIGNVLASTITDKGYKVRAEIKEADAIEKIQDGRLRTFSIGYIPLETELQHEDGTPFNFEKDSPWDADLIRVIKSLDLVEISVVSTPANGHALFTISKSIKSYFQEVVTKSFGMKKKIAEQVDEPAENAGVPDETPVETPAQETPAAPEAGVEAPAGEGEGKDAPETDPNANQPAPAEAGTEPKQENAEKPAETAGADGGEGANTPEEPKAEAAPAEGGSPAEGGEEGKTLQVSETAAKAFPELVAAGLMVVGKSGEQMTKGVETLLRKLCDAYIAEAKRAQTLEEKLNAIPEKQSFATHGQFTPAAPKAKATEPSDAFKKMFNL